MNSVAIPFLQKQLAPIRAGLLHHHLYKQLHKLTDVQVFMEYHVFAVWDFMSLLKSLQRDLTCVALPWMPTPNLVTRRFINEIVLEEESDIGPDGQPTSHFELYLRAMEECGANTIPIRKMLAALAEGASVTQALDAAQVPEVVRQFVETTFSIIRTGQVHMVASAFTFGREDVIPAMFRQLVGQLQEQFPGQFDTLIYYLDRHIQLDEKVHTPLAYQMVRELCGDDPQCWQDAQQVAQRSIEARILLWNGIGRALHLRPVLA